MTTGTLWAFGPDRLVPLIHTARPFVQPIEVIADHFFTTESAMTPKELPGPVFYIFITSPLD
ncbi:hypothetical protein CEP51_015765 [Fusarium floridanum]|uniref:Uncharacterized protein n=1 Tax=Fusarium floridanum TaxID=1325733 RepID=A0A428P3A9_9HYPO|nr:hypothetical protein CEP51_015765 [Fusarium floridanum]